MRVLHLTPELPYEPGGGGGRGREYFLCRWLAERGHDVLNISPILPHERPWTQALPDAGVESWTVVRPASHLCEAARAALSEPELLAVAVRDPVRALEMRVFWTALRAHVERAVGEWRPDIAVIGHDMAATWARGLPESLPAVLTLHNLTWHWYLSRARRAHGADAVRLRAEAGRYRRYLVRLLPRFDAAVAVSTIEAEELRRLTTRRVTVIPSGVDTRAITVAPEPATEPPRLVFTASLGYPPNSQGIRWFADRVWPEVRRALPRARLDVVGRGAPHEVVVLGEREGITVVGEVERMDPYFARAHAVIVPILTGAGIRMKIVEAMAAGRPIVSTPLGWEGLPHIEPDRHLLVADDPPAFAAAVVRLLSEPELRARLAAQARRLAEEHYDWRGLGAEQEAVLERAYTARQ